VQVFQYIYFPYVVSANYIQWLENWAGRWLSCWCQTFLWGSARVQKTGNVKINWGSRSPSRSMVGWVWISANLHASHHPLSRGEAPWSDLLMFASQSDDNASLRFCLQFASKLPRINLHGSSVMQYGYIKSIACLRDNETAFFLPKLPNILPHQGQKTSQFLE